MCDRVLSRMGKPEFSVYQGFADRYKKMNEKLGKKQYLVPYLISSHPGSTLKDAIALAEAAQFLDVSESYLSRRFHRETGRTLVDYLNHIRIDRARLLLSSSGHLRVHRVAELCGFSNAHYFALRFKKEVGMTPV